MDTVSEKEVRSGRISGDLSFQLRSLTCADLDAVLALTVKSAEKAWSRQDFAYFLCHAQNLSVGMWIGVGECSYLASFCVGQKSESTLDIIYIATAPEARQRGLAARLLSHLQRLPEIERITLEVAEGNLPAVSLYKRHAFSVQSVRARYYQNRYHALRMQWQRGAHSRA